MNNKASSIPSESSQFLFFPGSALYSGLSWAVIKLYQENIQVTMIRKWSDYCGFSLGLHQLEWFLYYTHMSVNKFDSNVKQLQIF